MLRRRAALDRQVAEELLDEGVHATSIPRRSTRVRGDGRAKRPGPALRARRPARAPSRKRYDTSEDSGVYSRPCASATGSYVILPSRTFTPLASAASSSTACFQPLSAMARP